MVSKVQKHNRIQNKDKKDGSVKTSVTAEFNATNLATTWRRWKVTLQLCIDLVQVKKNLSKLKCPGILLGIKAEKYWIL